MTKKIFHRILKFVICFITFFYINLGIGQNKKQQLELKQTTIDSLYISINRLELIIEEYKKSIALLQKDKEQLGLVISRDKDSFQLIKDSCTIISQKNNLIFEQAINADRKYEILIKKYSTLQDSFLKMKDSINIYKEGIYDMRNKKLDLAQSELYMKELSKMPGKNIKTITEWLANFRVTASVNYTYIDKEYAKAYVDGMKLSFGNQNLPDTLIDVIEKMHGKINVSHTVYDCGIILTEEMFYEEMFWRLEIPRVPIEVVKRNLQYLIGNEWWGSNWKSHPHNITFTKSPIGTIITWTINP